MNSISTIVFATASTLLLSSCVIEVPDSNANNGTATQLPADSGVPRYVIDQCLASLRGQVGYKPMSVLSSRKGENSYIVDVQVDGAQAPWRCYHDGSRCTGTEYQGQG